MRQWTVDNSPAHLGNVLADAIQLIGEPRFEHSLLARVNTVLPAASCSVYLTGAGCRPALFMSASHGIPDTTVDCWRAYLSGPQRTDRTFAADTPLDRVPTQMSHITAQEVPPEHRAKVYEAHGVAERVSIVERHNSGGIFAINFYRHQHQHAFRDHQIDAVQAMAQALLALTHKHLALRAATPPAPARATAGAAAGATTTADASVLHQAQLRGLCGALTPRELEVCAALLRGLTADGIACALGLSVPTVKTYRNRAFDKLGIRFRNQLFALVLHGGAAGTRLQ